MGYGLVESGFESRQWQENFDFPKIFTPSLETNQPLINGVPGFCPRQVMQPGRNTVQSRHLGQRLTMSGATIPLPLYAFMACKGETLPALFYSIVTDVALIQTFQRFLNVKSGRFGN